jgi:hypothetical protein
MENTLPMAEICSGRVDAVSLNMAHQEIDVGVIAVGHYTAEFTVAHIESVHEQTNRAGFELVLVTLTCRMGPLRRHERSFPS